MNLYYTWASFWLSYFIFNCLIYDDQSSITKKIITTKQLLNNLGKNAIVTFILTIIMYFIPPLMIIPTDFYGYIKRIIIALVVGEVCFYWFHRALHYPFYKFHADHHTYVVPHSFAGLYAHPVEMIFNFFSILIALQITNHFNIILSCIEGGAVALSISINHSGHHNWLFSSKHHNKHHKKLNCNYGFLMLTDWIFKTLQ